MPVDEAIAWAQEAGQSYKEELLNDLKRAGTTEAKDLDADELGTIADGDGKVSDVNFYTNEPFTDLCRGPHVDSTGQVGAFKLMRVAGAYWRGDETKTQMQRLYGVAFETKEELQAHLEQIEEAKRRDHRKLGKELDLFTFSEKVGSGLPMFTPRGSILRDNLSSFSQQLRAKYGFSRVWTPHITKNDLYKASGHWDKFGDELFVVDSQETSDSFVMKPMNCPHHIQIYSSQPRSYRDLPIRYMETTTDYRDEKSGELHGLSRVRSLTQDDSHAFVREDQIESAATELIHSAQELYSTLDMQLKFRLSFRDGGDGYLGDPELWARAQADIEKLAKANELDYYIEEGEAAFYGPKIDFIAVDGLGREWQVATIQIDFVQPERFELEYTNTEGGKSRPVMIHSALLGSIERFLSVYIEHTAGRFPFWLAPEQIRVVTVGEDVEEYVEEITTKLDDMFLMKPLKFNEIRYSVDAGSDSLGKRIRNAEKMKVPIVVIIGPKDKDAREVSVRTQEGESKVAFDDLEQMLRDL
jgi:threonyl-tRNA synthetase